MNHYDQNAAAAAAAAQSIKMEPRTPLQPHSTTSELDNGRNSFPPMTNLDQVQHHHAMGQVQQPFMTHPHPGMHIQTGLENGGQRLWEAPPPPHHTMTHQLPHPHPHPQSSPTTTVSSLGSTMPCPMGRRSGQTSPDSSTSSNNSPSKMSQEQFNSNGAAAGDAKRKGAPYIPSYMDLTNGPEPCVVCGDAATGYHYRCMTCEGCKGFFRRTIQKDLQYHCKWNNGCAIDKTSRNQCQYCRFQKCVAVGMATDLVLNERQRVAKRKLIDDNREKRKQDMPSMSKMRKDSDPCDSENLTEEDRGLIDDIVMGYEDTATKSTAQTRVLPSTSTEGPPGNLTGTDPDVWHQLAEVMTPSIVKVIEFAKRVPGFLQLDVDDQILLLKSCCMEIMCLRAACRFDPVTQTLTLQNGLVLTREQLQSSHGGLPLLVEPIFEFAAGLAKLQLDETETGLLAAVLLMQSDRTGLKEPDAVERIQDAILGAYKRYISDKRPSQPVHWAKILMKVTDLRTISTRHAERVLCIKLDAPGELPPLFLEMFDEAPPVVTLQLLMGIPLSEVDMG